MVTLKGLLARFLGAGLLLGALQLACQGPDEFFRNGNTLTGTGGEGVPTGGSSPGTGGSTSTGGTSPGTGGTIVSTGGNKGTGGVVSTGGTPGTGGAVSTGGNKGTGGVVSTGGTPGTGGVVSTGGVPGTGGVVSTGGVKGTGGAIATGGTPGTGGATATGGTSGGTGPCAGLCATTPIEIATQQYSSGSVGTAAVCYESTSNIGGGNCYNFVAPRTLTVNGTAEPCTTGGNWTLPAKVAGGYCVVISAGDYSYAGFTTF
ncbi:MAG TPA: hypothetical protein VHH90_10605 [Polyangia bacterium]|nr:hypothetical protein [Polyangia bacterium]